MANCPRPGCSGEVVNGNCQLCGIAVAPSDSGSGSGADSGVGAAEAARLRRVAEEAAARLYPGSGTGWFRPADAPPDPGVAHRRPEASAEPDPPAVLEADEDAQDRAEMKWASQLRKWRTSQAAPHPSPQSAPQAVAQPTPEGAPQAGSQPAPQAAPQPVPQPAPQAAAQPTAEPVPESAARPAAESAAQSARGRRCGPRRNSRLSQRRSTSRRLWRRACRRPCRSACRSPRPSPRSTRGRPSRRARWSGRRLAFSAAHRPARLLRSRLRRTSRSR